MKLLGIVAFVSLLASGSAQAYQVLPDPFAVNSTDQTMFYWTGDTGSVEGITASGSDFSGLPAPGLGDTQWVITAPVGGIVLDFIQVYSAIEQSNYLLRDNGVQVSWDFVDNPGSQYSYNNLFNYSLTPGQHVFTVEVLNSSGPYYAGEGPLGPNQYSWAVITFNTDPGVAPAVPLPASALVLSGGLGVLAWLKGARRRRV